LSCTPWKRRSVASSFRKPRMNRISWPNISSRESKRST
jgi:hypothetical protein